MYNVNEKLTFCVEVRLYDLYTHQVCKIIKNYVRYNVVVLQPGIGDIIACVVYL